ncbi:MAG: aldo/keto reductase [Lachnospiraceae bacterium]|nr:aldo/keto reductase [Lachnospiraceae bacterium]
MQYRINRRTGDKISMIGLGSSYMFNAGLSEGVKAVRRAFEGGVNYYDFAAGDIDAFPICGEALSGDRKDVLYQVHFGTDFSKKTYGWSLDLDTVKRSVDEQLRLLKTDYIDYGFIHCLDELSDWETYKAHGIYVYIEELRKAGVVKHLGASSHTPAVIQKILDDAPVDMLMFSVNPGYDYGEGEYAFGGVDERTAVYKRCEAEGIGISVMKPFSGGQLLDAKTSPFGKALTPYQCIRYALDKPGVLTVLPGAQSVSEVEYLLAYFDQQEDVTDYSVIGTFAPPQAQGKCVYCNHCKPCPMGLDIGLINKYYDLAKAGDDMAAEHYRNLSLHADDCVSCGHCDSRCPFGVAQSERMQEIAAYFG